MSGANAEEGFVQPLSDRERKRAIGERFRQLRKLLLRLPRKIGWPKRRRQSHWAQEDVFEALLRAGVYCDFSQIVRLERGTAPLDAEFAEKLCQVLKAGDVQAALISHANRSGGVYELLLKRLGVQDTHLAACRQKADEALRGQITDTEFDELITATAGIIVIEIMRRYRASQGGADDEEGGT